VVLHKCVHMQDPPTTRHKYGTMGKIHNKY
jgi:hypothetical protein